MALKPYTPRTGVPLRGGAVTDRDAASLRPGQFSMAQNVRPKHPGFIKRPGQAVQHTVADGTNQVLTTHQFRKKIIDETHLFAQMGDGDILEATTAPPGKTTGVLGVQVYSGGASQRPASWGELNDILVMGNGVDQFQVYAGKDNYVKAFVKFDGSAAPPDIPDLGSDYSSQVTDGLTTTHAVLDSLNTLAAFECVFICTPVRANRLTWTFGAGKANATAAVGTLSYRKSDGTWADTAETDGTILSTATLGQNGSMYWTPPTDEVPHYMFGISGFWYRWVTATQLDAEIEVTKVTYGTDHDAAGERDVFTPLVNVWDGLTGFPVEVVVYDNSAGTYNTFGATNVDLGTITFDENDALYIGSVYPITAAYLDPGSAPNTGAATAIDAGYYWNGAAFTTVGTVTDETNGLKNAGWVTFPGHNFTPQPSQFNGARYYLYWYKFEVDGAVSTTLIVNVETMPIFDVNDFGSIGNAVAPWQDRMCYAFKRWGQYVHVSKRDAPLVLNGVDYAVLEAGDGRSNEVIAMSKFFNEMIAWQEEKGIEGGCTTLFEGYSPATYGKLLLSSKVGIVNAKAFVVVDGVLTSTATDERIRTLAFWISRYGVCVTDGTYVSVISDDIQNYFDPTDAATCIRRGYEHEHFIAFDSTYKILRLGLVTGASATKPNVFPCFDLVDKCWYFDGLAQPLSCMEEIESGSTAIPITHIGGGTADGTVYILNTGLNDVSTAIDSYLDIEFTLGGEYLVLRELLLRCSAQAAGNITLTCYNNKVSAFSETLSMLAENSSEEVRRNRLPLDLIGHLLTVRIQHNTAGQACTLYDLGVKMDIWGDR